MSGQLSAHVREEIDRWVAKFPPDRKRSAVISALHAVQHENHGFLTVPLMDAVADYLGLPPILVYEIATFYSMFETKPVGRHHVSVCTNISCMLRGSAGGRRTGSRKSSASRPARARPMGAFTSSARRNVSRHAPARR